MGKYITPLSSAAKNFELSEAMKATLKSKEAKKENERILLESELAVKQEEVKKVAHEMALKRRHTLIEEVAERDRVFDKNFKTVMGTFFATVVYESLPLDEEVKEIEIEKIHEDAMEMFNSLSEANTINITGSPLFKEFTGSIVKHIEGFRTELTKDQIFDVVKELHTNHKDDIHLLSRNVYEKTAQVIKTEREIVGFNQKTLTEDLSDNSKFVRDSYTKTLFRSINEERISALASSGLPKDKVLDLALAESLYTYTILETLHTANLMTVDVNKLRRFTESYK